MRVLSVGNRYPPWSSGGYEATWAAHVAHLRAAGHTVRVLTTLPDPTDRPPSGPRPEGVYRELRWYWRAHAFPRLGIADTVRLERANAAVLRRHLADLAPDAVMWWAMGGMSLGLLEQARRAGVPAVAVVGDDWPVYGPQVDGWTRRFGGPGRALARPAQWLTGLPTTLELDRAARWSMNSRHTLAAVGRPPARLHRPSRHRPGALPLHPRPAVGLAAALLRADRRPQGDRHRRPRAGRAAGAGHPDDPWRRG